MEDELIFTVKVAEGQARERGALTGASFTITPLPERDPTTTAFLVSFSASAALEVLLALKRLAGRRGMSLAMKHNGHRLTITTDDEDLNIELISRVMKDFYRKD